MAQEENKKTTEADNNENAGNNNNQGNNNPGNENGGGNGGGNEKTFSQAEVNRMMAKEKKQGVNSVYNDLGINPADEETKNAIKEFIKSRKTDDQKNAEAIAAENAKVAEATRRAEIAEAKAEAMKAGVQPQYVDDVVTLILAKASGDEEIDVATSLGEFKTKYPMWFEKSEESSSKDGGKKNVGQKGTGSSVSSGKKDKADDNKNLGARLAAKRKSTGNKKSYWSN